MAGYGPSSRVLCLACRECVLAWFERRLDGVAEQGVDKDAKTRLQEFLQARQLPLPDYQLAGVEGEDHRQQFTVTCQLQQPALAESGTGVSRRRAEQDAAARVLARLGE